MLLLPCCMPRYYKAGGAFRPQVLPAAQKIAGTATKDTHARHKTAQKKCAHSLLRLGGKGFKAHVHRLVHVAQKAACWRLKNCHVRTCLASCSGVMPCLCRARWGCV